MSSDGRRALLAAVAVSCLTGSCVGEEISVPTGTPLTLRVDQHMPLRIGAPIRAQLLYPVYAGEMLLLPANTTVTGSVVGLQVSRSKRIRARLNGDFTPFYTPLVRFTRMVLADGREVPIEAETVTDGAPVYRLVAPPPRKGGFVRQEFEAGKQIVRDDIAIFTGPGKQDRLVQFLYGQLPYHPQRIEKGTAWTVETSAPLTVPGGSSPAAMAEAATPPSVPSRSPQPVEAEPKPDTWVLEASLAGGLDSATAHSGQEVRAVVAQPVFNADRSVAVPQGATLLGAVTQVRPARRFGRAGVLRFDFREIQMPGAAPQKVQASLTGADSSGENLSLTAEGEVKSKPADKLSVPLILAALASRPLDRDGGDGGTFKNGVGSNGFGVVGRVLGLAGGSPYFAAGLGYYEAALTFYDRWIAKGKQVTFARDTRIVVQTTARRGAVLAGEVKAPQQ